MVWIESITSSAGGCPRRSVVRMSRTEVAAASRTGAAPRPSRRARSRTWSAASSPRNIGDLAPAVRAIRAAACSSRVDLPMPGSPPIRVAEPAHEAAADRAVELGDPGRQPLRQRDRRVEPDQLDRAARRPADCAWRRRARHLRRILDQACSIPRSRRIAPASGC